MNSVEEEVVIIATGISSVKRKEKGKGNYIRNTKTLVKNEMPGRNRAYSLGPLSVYKTS